MTTPKLPAAPPEPLPVVGLSQADPTPDAVQEDMTMFSPELQVLVAQAREHIAAGRTMPRK